MLENSGKYYFIYPTLFELWENWGQYICNNKSFENIVPVRFLTIFSKQPNNSINYLWFMERKLNSLVLTDYSEIISLLLQLLSICGSVVKDHSFCQLILFSFTVQLVIGPYKVGILGVQKTNLQIKITVRKKPFPRPQKIIVL